MKRRNQSAQHSTSWKKSMCNSKWLSVAQDIYDIIMVSFVNIFEKDQSMTHFHVVNWSFTFYKKRSALVR